MSWSISTKQSSVLIIMLLSFGTLGSEIWLKRSFF